MACFRLVTLSPELERSVPRLRRRMVLSTSSIAFFEYLLRDVGMTRSRDGRASTGVRQADTRGASVTGVRHGDITQEILQEGR